MLSHIPVWVFAVFALLIALGIWQSRPRTVSPAAPALLAAGFLLYSLYGVISSFGASAACLLPWALAVLSCVLAGSRAFGPTDLTRVPGTTKVRIPGSWLPLGLMLGIFVAKFAVGFVAGARLSVGTQAWFAPAVSFVLGALSGGFASRAVTIRRYIAQAAGDA
jgi:hypothetical protein